MPGEPARVRPAPARVLTRWGHRMARILAGLLLLVAAAGLVARFVTWRTGWALGIAALSPYLMLGAPLALVVLLVLRGQWSAWRVAMVLVAGVLAGGLVATQAPLLRAAQGRPPDSVTLTVLTANLRLGQADPGSLVALVRDRRVDVLSAQELTGAEVARLHDAGLDDLLPFRRLDARDEASGVGLWSRYPLRHAGLDRGFEFAFVQAQVVVPGVTPAPTLAAAHMSGPWPQSPRHWLADMARLRTTLRGLARTSGGGAIVLGGDLNATLDTAQYRSVLADRFHDAAAQSGSGITRTYPATGPLPALLALDHVITCRAVATAARTVALPGSDHRGLLVEVAIARHQGGGA